MKKQNCKQNEQPVKIMVPEGRLALFGKKEKPKCPYLNSMNVCTKTGAYREHSSRAQLYCNSASENYKNCPDYVD